MLINEADFLLGMPVSATFSFKKVTTDVRTLENRHIKELLGATLYNSLEDVYNNGTPSTVEAALIENIHPIYHLALWSYVDKGNVVIDDIGVSAIHSETKKPAFEHQLRSLKKSLKVTGYNAMEDLLVFLEENISDYPDWVSDTADEESRQYFINSATVFQEYVNIQNSRVMYLEMLPVMKRMESDDIAATICQELFDEIKSQLTSLTLSVENSALLSYIRGAVAHLTWSRSLVELAVTIDEEGIHLLNNSFAGTVNALTPAEMDRINSISINHEHIGQGYLGKLKNYLQNNADSYPLYKESDCYIDLDNDETDQFENDPDSSIVLI